MFPILRQDQRRRSRTVAIAGEICPGWMGPNQSKLGRLFLLVAGWSFSRIAVVATSRALGAGRILFALGLLAAAHGGAAENLVPVGSAASPGGEAQVQGSLSARTGTTLSLDGENWLSATDPNDLGKNHDWFRKARSESKPTRVPWTFLADFKNYHGVTWYWRSFAVPAANLAGARTLLRFWAVDYKADVWVNGMAVGGHEGAETPFVLDVTDAVRPGEGNVLAVRVVNPDETPIDGLVRAQVPHRNKTNNFPASGDPYNYGGILDSVELLVAPAVRIADLFVRPDPATGRISVRLAVKNEGGPAPCRVELTAAEDATGAVDSFAQKEVLLGPGENVIEGEVMVKERRLWQLDDPHLYRVTARLVKTGDNTFDQQSVRCGFRDFRLQDGYFALNGKRLFLKSSHTGDGAPIGYVIAPPSDPDLLRRDLIYMKTMGFNTVRFICGMPTRSQVELCDEIGLLVYEESYASWLLEDSPKMAERFDRSTSEMIQRDRNHPSVVIWGLLNETPSWGRKDSRQSTIFAHAVQTLPLVRSLDATRLVLLNSGRFDRRLDVGSVSNPGSNSWDYLLGAEAPGAPMGKADPDFCIAYIKGAGDVHIYPSLPHGEAIMQFLRTVGQGTKHVFVSEYGYDPALDMSLLVRNYEQRGQEDYSSAFFRSGLDRFMKDWDRWDLASCFGRPEDYFRACVAVQTEIRTLGLNAIRSNPNLIGYNLTGLVDGYSGEGLITYFHELKPGMVDAISDGLAPLRWCLFAGPPDSYRGGRVKLEAVLANEDVLLPGNYEAQLDIFGPGSTLRLERTARFSIRDPRTGPRAPLALKIFSEEVVADWPQGSYRFVAKLERGGAAAGGEAVFDLTDPQAMPPVPGEVVLWGNDPDLSEWLGKHGIRVRLFSEVDPGIVPRVILAGKTSPQEREALGALIQSVKRGSTAVLLDPDIFKVGTSPPNLSAIAREGKLIALPNIILIADYWAKQHPIFEGLPCGGLMDYRYYRDIISNSVWQRRDVPEETVAGGIVSSPMYASGLSVTVDKLELGRVILNTLKIESNLGSDPAAERLLRNLLRYAGSPQNAVGR